MTLRMLFVPLVPFLLLFPSISHAETAGPSSYDECIIDTMRGVSSDVAARAIMESCRSLFPGEQPDAGMPSAPAPVPAAPEPLETTGARDLTADELARLDYRAKVFGSAYSVTVENGNPDLTLTEVTIAVWDDGSPVASREEYSETVQIAPQTSALVKYTVHYRGDETGWNWAVVAARGEAFRQQ